LGFNLVLCARYLLLLIVVHGILLIALGLALAAWQIRALLPRRGTLRFTPVRTRLKSAAVLSLALGCALLGAVMIAGALKSTVPVVAVVIAVVSIAFWLGTTIARGRLYHELKSGCDEFRRDYPGLDREAMFRSVVKNRHPEWDTGRILTITEDCGSVGELARRLRAEEIRTSLT